MAKGCLEEGWLCWEGEEDAFAALQGRVGDVGQP